jgi:phosphotriesterase-related protein
MLKPGKTYSHEHIAIDLSGIKNTEDTRLDCMEETIKEFREIYEKGVRNIIELTNRGMGRNIDYILKVAKETGMNVIAATGFYKEPFFPKEVYELSEEELCRLMVQEIEVGIADTGVKAGVIGEIGSSADVFLESERKVFRAAIEAQLQTGRPVITHTSLGTLALEQVEMFKMRNVDLDKVIISHVDLSGDVEYILQIIRTGVNVAFDTIGKENYQPDELRIQMLKRICDEGLAHKVLLSMDITRKSNFRYKGGIGYAYLLDQFIPRMMEAGIAPEDIEKMTETNIQRIMLQEER